MIAILIGAGYGYDRFRGKMSWLDIDPGEVKLILVTHRDTDHMGVLERAHRVQADLS